MLHAFEPPQGADEATIAELWAELLGVDRVGRHDDFFELGGHSVLAMGMLSSLRSTLNADLSMTDLFQSSRLAAFAKVVCAARSAVTTAAPVSVPSGDEFPLSPAQERIWFMEQLVPGTATYHLHWAVRIKGPLIPAAMEQALREVQLRHDVLRSVFVETEKGTVQIVKPFTGGTLDRFDLSGLPPAERETALETLMLEHARTPFDLGEGPPLRLYLIKLASDDWSILLNMHHLVGDGWSEDRFFRDVSALYTALISGEPPALEPLRMQYGQFALEQLARLDQPELQASRQYWLQQLRQPLESHQLDTDFPRPEQSGYAGRTQSRYLSRELLAAAQELGREEGATLFMVLVAAFQVLLHRYNGKTDIVVGTDVANRALPGAVPMIGLFVNQVVLRTQLSGQPTFREVLRRVRRTTAEAFEHQEVPFDQLVRELSPTRNTGDNPLFQIMLVMHSATPRHISFEGLKVQPVVVEIDTAPFDLTVFFADEGADGLYIGTRYRSDLFRDVTITRLMQHLEILLASAVARPGSRIDELDLYTSEELAEQQKEKERAKASRRAKLLSAVPREIDGASAASVVSGEVEESGRTLPFVVKPRTRGVLLEQFARRHGTWIEDRLQRHGAILFRGFDIDSAEGLNELTAALVPRGALDYSERSSPRSRILGNVFTSTDHPCDQRIVLHNEQSYTLNWPMKILFACLEPARSGGSTPIADSRRILDRLGEGTVSEFERRDITYIRNYGEGVGLTWNVAFQTDDPSVVEARCAAAQIELEWKCDGGLRTRQRRPAIRRHPITGERVWFNHAFFFNVASLENGARTDLVSAMGEDNLPYRTCFGDGGAIGEELLADIRQAIEAETISFQWARGDLLLIDNMLVAHGRDKYVGPRQIAVTMAQTYEQLLQDVHSR